MQVDFELPICPSGNHRNVYSRRGVFRSKAYANYMQVAGWLLKPVKVPRWAAENKLGVRVVVHPKNARMTDLDNAVKVAFDAIDLHLGVNDAWYWHMELDRGEIIKPDGKLVITIWELGGQYPPCGGQ